MFLRVLGPPRRHLDEQLANQAHKDALLAPLPVLALPSCHLGEDLFTSLATAPQTAVLMAVEVERGGLSAHCILHGKLQGPAVDKVMLFLIK